MPQFTPNGCVATPSLIRFLQTENGPWARAILGQCFSMPDHVQKLLLSGAVEWQIPNEKTLTINLVESQ